MQQRIVVVGSLNMDLVVRTGRIPAPGETVLGAGDLCRFPGGKGANQACAAARLGAAAHMVGRVGEDAFGRELLESLGRDGVDTAAVQTTAGLPTGVALIVVDAAGQNSIVVSAGANAHLTPADVDRVAPMLRAAGVVMLQLEVPLPAVLRAAEVGRQGGALVVLNPAPAQPLPAALLSCVDVLVPNETELALLAGGSGPVAKAARTLRTRTGIGTVVVTLGAQGALLVGDSVAHVPAFPVTPVDTTAAGDAFVAALAVALAEGRPPVDAVRFGNAAGALAATRPGAQTALPDRAAVEAILHS